MKTPCQNPYLELVVTAPFTERAQRVVPVHSDRFVKIHEGRLQFCQGAASTMRHASALALESHLDLLLSQEHPPTAASLGLT